MRRFFWESKRVNSCCLHVSFCLSREDYQVRFKLLWTIFALIFHACVGRSGSIEGLLVRDSQTSESLCCVLEQDNETGIKQKDKNSSQSDCDEKYQSKQTFYWIHPGRPIPKRPNDCWLGRKESSQANENKQTNKPNASTLSSQAQLSLIHVKSLQNTLSHPNPINPPHAPIESFEKDILTSRIQCYSTGCW